MPLCYNCKSRKVDPFNLKTEDIGLEDIALRLARIHRWAAAAPYTVAEHSIACACLVRADGFAEHVQRWALLHDAAEAWLGDVPAPLREGLGWTGGPTYDEAEEAILAALCRRWPILLTESTALSVGELLATRTTVAIADQRLRDVEEELFFGDLVPSGDRRHLAHALDPYGLRTGPEAAARAQATGLGPEDDPGPGDRRIADVFIAHALSLGLD
jgi:hypothetical protein